MFGIEFTKFMVYFGEEIGDFRLCSGRFPPADLFIYLFIFILFIYLFFFSWPANESKTLSLSDQPL